MKLIALLLLTTGCSSIMQRHDFLTSPSEEKVCGKSEEQQNTVVVNFKDEKLVVQSKSLNGLYMSGPFFAPVLPWHTSGHTLNVVRVYSQKPSEDLKSWTLTSDDKIHKPLQVEIKQIEGTIGAFQYTQMTELTFDRRFQATDFTLTMQLNGETKTLKFQADQDWSYQWMGNEITDPQCISR